jgi:hypothetical protein
MVIAELKLKLKLRYFELKNIKRVIAIHKLPISSKANQNLPGSYSVRQCNASMVLKPLVATRRRRCFKLQL